MVTGIPDHANGMTVEAKALPGPATAIMSGAEQSESASGTTVEAKALTASATTTAPAPGTHSRLNGSYPGL